MKKRLSKPEYYDLSVAVRNLALSQASITVIEVVRQIPNVKEQQARNVLNRMVENKELSVEQISGVNVYTKLIQSDHDQGSLLQLAAADQDNLPGEAFLKSGAAPKLSSTVSPIVLDIIDTQIEKHQLQIAELREQINQQELEVLVLDCEIDQLKSAKLILLSTEEN